VTGGEKAGCLVSGLAWIVFALVLNALVTFGDCNSSTAAQQAACESARSHNYAFAFLIDAAVLAGILFVFWRRSTKD